MRGGVREEDGERWGVGKGEEQRAKDGEGYGMK